MTQILIWIGGGALMLFLLYALAPTIFYKWIRRSDLESEDMMLTFDDGPDEEHTSHLLDLLKETHVRATFFVLASKALEHPQILSRMIEEGHRIALHGVDHKNNWFQSPAAVDRQLREGKALLEAAGYPVSYYRPPYGNINLALPYYLRKQGMKMVLWSVMAQDWRKGISAEEILTRLEKRSGQGSLICLHDSGAGTGGTKEGPGRTVEALRVFLPEMTAAGYRFLLPEEAGL